MKSIFRFFGMWKMDAVKSSSAIGSGFGFGRRRAINAAENAATETIIHRLATLHAELSEEDRQLFIASAEPLAEQ